MTGNDFFEPGSEILSGSLATVVCYFSFLIKRKSNHSCTENLYWAFMVAERLNY